MDSVLVVAVLWWFEYDRLRQLLGGGVVSVVFRYSFLLTEITFAACRIYGMKRKRMAIYCLLFYIYIFIDI